MPSFLLLLLVQGAALPSDVCPSGEPVAVTLAFPQAGLDDPAAYEGYRTRFFRDAAGNTVQVYIKERDGRVVNLWADAANESVGFTARDAAGAPATLTWAGDSACVTSSGRDRSIRYRLRSNASELALGHFVLGSMRVERDFQYPGLHLQPFGPAHVLPELRGVIERVERLPEPERRRHLALLHARDTAELSARLRPTIRFRTEGGARVARIEQPSFDGRNRLAIEIAVAAADAELRLDGDSLRIVAPAGHGVDLALELTTDAAPLTPLRRDDIFNPRFNAFYESIRAARDRALRSDPGAASSDPRVIRYRLLERQVRGLELVSSREKLLAGLPNYATYFGRDLLVAALLMQPIWAGTMNEHVLGSVLRKLSPDGQVSHEEALGGQAIREHAVEYAALVDRALELDRAGDAGAAAERLEDARSILGDMQRVRENYAMVDDEFQLPVLAAKYLTDPEVPAARKRDFLLEPGRADPETSRLALLLRNLVLVADLTAAYAREPIAGNLVGFPARTPGVYHAASWRDSGAGYGNGRYAMDVNAIWVPQALESTATILEALRGLGLGEADLRSAAPSLPSSVLGEYVRDGAALQTAIGAWRGATRHFRVRLSPGEARARVAAKLASLPADEARHWAGVMDRAELPEGGIGFLALSLDGNGEPIPVLNTDVATRWLLDDVTASLLDDPAQLPDVMDQLTAVFLPYPVGLFVEGLGPLVANDAYATPEVWAGFERDDYHSPRVVWGREVNLLLLGLMRQIDDARDEHGRLRDARLRPYVETLEGGLQRALDEVRRSGLEHNELWSYRIENGRLLPIRWGASTDVQLWNLTDLAVEFLLAERGVVADR